MKIVITGATGNVGTSLVEALAAREQATEIVGVARRIPDLKVERTRFVAADVSKDDLEPLFQGADAVVHLAWLIQPQWDKGLLHQVNVQGSRRVFRAAVAAGVPCIVHASSFGAYSAAPEDRRVDESWPTQGISSSLYSRQKVAVERQLDDLEREQPDTRIVRMRPATIFKRGAASELRRYFVGRLVPTAMFRRSRIPLVPDFPELRFQVVHSLDVGEAFATAVLSDVRGAFNLAADPVIDVDVLATTLRARKVRMKASTLRALVDVTYRLRLQPSDAGFFDLLVQGPLVDASRAKRELRWTPRRSSTEALLEVFTWIAERAGMPTAPLQPAGQT